MFESNIYGIHFPNVIFILNSNRFMAEVANCYNKLSISAMMKLSLNTDNSMAFHEAMKHFNASCNIFKKYGCLLCLAIIVIRPTDKQRGRSSLCVTIEKTVSLIKCRKNI